MNQKQKLLELIDQYAEARHIQGHSTYNIKTAAARREVEDELERAPSAAVFGSRLVPVEPTDQMVQAAHHIDLSYMPGQEGADRAAIYRAMIAAAPQPAPAPVSDDTKRLNWLLWKLPGDALRYVVGELSDTSSGAEFRAAIDAALAAQ